MGPCFCWLDPHQCTPAPGFWQTAVHWTALQWTLHCAAMHWWMGEEAAGVTILTIWFVWNKELWLIFRFTWLICKFCITSKPNGQLVGIEWKAGSSGVCQKPKTSWIIWEKSTKVYTSNYQVSFYGTDVEGQNINEQLYFIGATVYKTMI